VWVLLPPVPVIVSLKVPVAVRLRVLTVNVEVPELLTGFGEKLPVVREGSPLTLKATVELNPPEAVTFTVYFTDDPRCTVWEVGVTEMEKSPVALTTSVAEVEWLSEPLVPVIVNG
jgi:hypothetical protein